LPAALIRCNYKNSKPRAKKPFFAFFYDFSVKFLIFLTMMGSIAQFLSG